MIKNYDGKSKEFEGRESASRKTLEDPKINVKLKLSVLWIALVFFYLYNDVISLFRKDVIEEALTGEMAGIQITQGFLFAGAVLMSIPIIMTFMSLALPARLNRPTTITVGIFHGVVLGATMLVPGETWAHYALYMVFEAVFITLIVLTAWKWPVQDWGVEAGAEIEGVEHGAAKKGLVSPNRY